MAFFDSRTTVFFLQDTDGTRRDLSGFILSVEGLPGQRELVQVSNLATRGAQWAAGLQNVVFGVSGMYEDMSTSGPDQVLRELRKSTIARGFEYGPRGSGSGIITYSGSCWVREYSIQSKVGEMVSFQAQFQVDSSLISAQSTGVGTGGGAGPYTPPGCSATIKAFIDAAAVHYNLPRWFLYAIVNRESSFDPDAYNPNGGYGLTQLTGAWYVGVRYPENLGAPNNSNVDWIYDMGLNQGGAYTNWINMNNVTAISDNAHRFDPEENLARFCSGYASAAVYWAKARYPSLDNNAVLRACAYHWNHGIFLNYLTDPDDPDYLTQYDSYVAVYRPAVEAEDGVWNGLPNIT